ncbi:DNA methyltransferase [Pseudomonas sp. ATCC PTA-122608]|nr:DNA cytosine methyltransferase [Pseudomonas sp. ATCC PTA-122608]OLY75749.1 DNA methyltransferase [Pseudomonas sp. ATCC PTA-122608]
MNELALFSGAGGGILGGQLMGWRTVCAVECDAYAAQVLAQRQNDRAQPAFPIWSDVCSFNGRPWRGIVDVVSGGFPCQDISIQGRGAGIEGARSGLWKEMARIVDEVRPTYVWLENSPMLVTRGLALVLGDLAKMGYDAQWCRVSASECGAPHKRDRIWLLAYPNSEYGQGIITQVAEAQVWQGSNERQTGPCGDGVRRWPTEPGVGRVVDGLAQRVDRIKALGNGQVPRVVASAFSIFKSEAKA